MAVVLLVEDDYFIRELAEETIQEFGHQTHSASDMGEALLFLRSDQHVDALVADIRLRTEPLGGLELARQAVRLRPLPSPHFQTSPKVAVKALFWRNNSAYLATRGRSRHSGILGMRS